MSAATTEQILTDLVTALQKDLDHAERGVTEATERIATADDKQHQREIVCHNEGYRDAIKRVLELVERVVPA